MHPLLLCSSRGKVKICIFYCCSVHRWNILQVGFAGPERGAVDWWQRIVGCGLTSKRAERTINPGPTDKQLRVYE